MITYVEKASDVFVVQFLSTDSVFIPKKMRPWAAIDQKGNEGVDIPSGKNRLELFCQHQRQSVIRWIESDLRSCGLLFMLLQASISDRVSFDTRACQQDRLATPEGHDGRRWIAQALMMAPKVV